MKHPIINGAVVVAAVAALLAGFGFFPVLVAAAGFWLILRVGVLMLGGLARPIPRRPRRASCARSRSPTGARSAGRRCA